MRFIPNRNEMLWMIGGTALLLVGIAMGIFFKSSLNPNEMIEARKRKIEIIDAMLLSLASSDEAEKSAVLSIDETKSKAFAEQSNDAVLEVARRGSELAELMKKFGVSKENDIYSQFAEAFEQYQIINRELLDLSTRNTNVKAYGLAYGPSVEKMNEMRNSLAQIIEKSSKQPDANKVALHALNAQIAVLHIQGLLPQHIQEENDQKMVDLEKQMSADEDKAKKEFDDLSALPSLKNSIELQSAAEAYAGFEKIKTEIIAFSRENTNVRSMSISLRQKSKISATCKALLNNLKDVVNSENLPPRSKPL